MSGVEAPQDPGCPSDSRWTLLDSSPLHQVGRPFPSEELEWLVATAFNHAVDYYARAEEQPCHRWALKAMALAEYADDGGALAALLRDRFAKLRFEQAPGAGDGATSRARDGGSRRARAAAERAHGPHGAGEA